MKTATLALLLSSTSGFNKFLSDLTSRKWSPASASNFEIKKGFECQRFKKTEIALPNMNHLFPKGHDPLDRCAAACVKHEYCLGFNHHLGTGCKAWRLDTDGEGKLTPVEKKDNTCYLKKKDAEWDWNVVYDDVKGVFDVITRNIAAKQDSPMTSKDSPSFGIDLAWLKVQLKAIATQSKLICEGVTSNELNNKDNCAIDFANEVENIIDMVIGDKNEIDKKATDKALLIEKEAAKDNTFGKPFAQRYQLASAEDKTKIKRSVGIASLKTFSEILINKLKLTLERQGKVQYWEMTSVQKNDNDKEGNSIFDKCVGQGPAQNRVKDTMSNIKALDKLFDATNTTPYKFQMMAANTEKDLVSAVVYMERRAKRWAFQMINALTEWNKIYTAYNKAYYDDAMTGGNKEERKKKLKVDEDKCIAAVKAQNDSIYKAFLPAAAGTTSSSCKQNADKTRPKCNDSLVCTAAVPFGTTDWKLDVVNRKELCLIKDMTTFEWDMWLNPYSSYLRKWHLKMIEGSKHLAASAAAIAGVAYLIV